MKYKIFKINKSIFFAILCIFMPFYGNASTTDGTILSGTNIGYGWSENAGYVNFGLSQGNIHVTNTSITGYAWDSVYGWMNLGPIVVGGTDYGVKNTTGGVLSGHAWSEGAGWISFNGITIDSSGRFNGTTSNNSIFGRLTFDCPTYCNVNTDWRPGGVEVGEVLGGTISGSYPIMPSLPLLTPPKIEIETIRPLESRVNEPGDTLFVVPSTQIPSFPDVGQEELARDLKEDTLIPSRLFDIKFTTDKTEINKLSDLNTSVSFINFGRLPSEVNMLFTILDDKNNKLFEESGIINIETEGLYNKKYPNLELSNGTYTANLHTSYGDGVEDDFVIIFKIEKDVGFLNIKISSTSWSIIILTFPIIFIIFKVILICRPSFNKNKK